jgi:REP element-mobilizing transposase RayT
MNARRYNPNIHHRRSIRLKGWDYRHPGAYFVTLVTRDREPLFGFVDGGTVKTTQAGLIAQTLWRNLPYHFAHVRLDEFIVMPNHLHAIIWLATNEGLPDADPPASPTRRLLSGSLGAVVGSYKSQVTRRINAMRHTPGAVVWQVNYYEHIIRNERALAEIRQYIRDNPMRWEGDPENPTLLASA